jgi:hypothetical protein
VQHALPAPGDLVALRPSRYRVFADANEGIAKRG